MSSEPDDVQTSESGGHWGVVPASEHHEILIALASLIRAQRYEMALTILDNELGGGC